MIYVNMLDDEELQRVIKTFLSGLLPHEKFEKECFVEILQSLTSYIKLEEFQMEYYVLISALTELNKVNISVQTTPLLTREIFSDIVEVSVEELITNQSVRMKEYLDHQGLQTNFAIQTVKEDAMQRLYSRSMDLYDECFEMAIPSSAVLSYMPAYKAAFVARTMLDLGAMQGTIIVKGAWIGKRFYNGYLDSLEYVTSFTATVNERLNDVENTASLFNVDSLEKIDEMNKSLKQAFMPICNWGFPPIDGDGVTVGTPILRHRLVVIVGSVNVGKSMFCKETAATVALNGGKALYMYGEGTKDEVWSGILINYIYRKYGKFVTTNMLVDRESQPEEIQKIIKMAEIELMESGAISFREAYNYDTFYEEVMNDYKRKNFDLLIVDHSLALASSGKTASENVYNLAEAARNLKRKLPICILIASHPSAECKSAMARDAKIPSEVTSTRESQNLEAEADDLFILRSNDIMEKQNLIGLETKKRRGAPHLHDNVILQKMYDVYHFDYDPARQAADELDNLDAEQALLEMEQAYHEDNYETMYTL